MDVTIVEFLDRMVPTEDGGRLSCSAPTRALLLSTKVENVEDTGSGVKVTVSPADGGDSQVLEADKMLAAFGFAPRVEGYGLDKAGVELTERGAIGVDARGRTNVKGIYAIGDVTREADVAHTAEAMGVIAAETIADAETIEIDFDTTPRATFCQPQIASFGYSEAQAKEKGYDVKVASFPFSANGSAGMAETVGLRTVADAEHNEIVGAHLIGPEVTELPPALTLAQKWTTPTRWRATSSCTRLRRRCRRACRGNRRRHDQPLRRDPDMTRPCRDDRRGPGRLRGRHVAAQLGAEVTIVDSDGMAVGRCPPTAVPSKTLTATAEVMSELAGAAELGVNFMEHEGDEATSIQVDLARVDARVKGLAADAAGDIERRPTRDGVTVIRGGDAWRLGMASDRRLHGPERTPARGRGPDRDRRRARRPMRRAGRRVDPAPGSRSRPDPIPPSWWWSGVMVTGAERLSQPRHPGATWFSATGAAWRTGRRRLRVPEEVRPGAWISPCRAADGGGDPRRRRGHR